MTGAASMWARMLRQLLDYTLRATNKFGCLTAVTESSRLSGQSIR